MKSADTSAVAPPLRLFVTVAALFAAASAVAEPPPDAPPQGFTPGQRSFSNPFATNPGAKPPPAFFDDEEEDDIEFPEDGFPPPPAKPAGPPPPGGAPRPPDPPATAPAPPAGGGISLGGPANPVIENNKSPPSTIDSETAEGSKEVVTDFNFPDADIMDIAKTLGKLAGKNFILDKDVKGRITIISNSPVTVGDAWKAFLTALDINGFALIPSGKYIRIARQRDARDKQLKTYTGDYSPDTDALITRLFPLKYLSAEEVARNFRSFMPANSRIIPYEQTNTVIVTDTGSNIAKLQRLLEILDIEGYDAGIEVIGVKYASAADIAKLIDTLLPGQAAVAGPGGSPRFAGGGGKFTARRTKEGGIVNTIIADERTNTLIVHANQKGTDQVRELVAKLDQKLPAVTGGGRVHVVYLQFAEAEQIANTLNNLSQAASSRPGGGGGSGTGVNPVQQSLFEGNIKIAADKATNSLVITASPADFVTVQRVINKLDIPRDQVFAEVVIMEINIGRDFQFSSNVASPASVPPVAFMPNSDLADFITSPFAQKGAVIGFGAGQNREITIGGTKFSVSSVTGLIKLLQTNSNANILATPQILTLDNTEASFDTTEKIPFPTTTAVSGAVSTSVSKENVSLSITIKPQINKMSNFVKLDITTKLTDISGREPPAQVKDLAFATIERNAKTSIVVADKDTVVLGGLTRDNVSDQISKIPILGDIPLLGWLFKSKRTQATKTNMLVFITPHIVRQYEAIRGILDKKLQDRDEFIEKNAGGEDPSRPYRDRMIRDLPEMKDILAKRPQTVQTIEAAQEGEVSAEAEGFPLERPRTSGKQQGNFLPPIDPGGGPQPLNPGDNLPIPDLAPPPPPSGGP